MVVTVALFEIHIPHAQSLKEKRMVVKSLRDRLRHRFEMSVGEVAYQDLHQRARLGFSFVTLDHTAAEANLERIRGFVESNTDAVVTAWMAEKLDFDASAQI